MQTWIKREGTKAWSLLNNLSGENKTRNPKPLFTEDGTIADDQRKANEHNKYFASTNKANKLNEEDKQLLKDLKTKEKTPFVQIKAFGENLTLSEFNKSLKKLKPRKSPGPDGIHNEMLTHLCTEAKTILLSIINITWQKGRTSINMENCNSKTHPQEGEASRKTFQLPSHIPYFMFWQASRENGEWATYLVARDKQDYKQTSGRIQGRPSHRRPTV